MKTFQICVLLFLALFSASTAHAFEMLGLVAYDISSVQNRPSSYTGTQNGIGYGFFGRLDFGPGKIESGFMYAPMGILTHESFGDVKTTGSYWMIPLLYRIPIYSPFFSLGVGFDYAIEGNTKIATAGTQLNGIISGYQNNFGAEVSLEATQDLGENLSVVFDARYRQGLQTSITIDGTNSKYNFFMLMLGLQKQL